MKHHIALLLAMPLVGAMHPAVAHHSFAMFDLHKVVQIKGTVEQYNYTNPHTWIVLLADNPAGGTSKVVLEANGPGYLARFGWSHDTLKAGDRIVAEAHPLRDGSPGGSLLTVTLADGRSLTTVPAAQPSAVAPAGSK